MNDPQNEPKGANDGPAVDPTHNQGLAQLMRLLAYKDAVTRFERAASASAQQLETEPQAVADLVEGKLHLVEVMNQLSEDPTVMSVVLLAVRYDNTNEKGPGFGITSGAVASPALIHAVLPMVHLLNEFEAMGVEPPALDGVDTEIREAQHHQTLAGGFEQREGGEADTNEA